MDDTPIFNRGFKKRPEQFIASLNKLAQQVNGQHDMLPIWNPDKTKVIILGQQPNGDFGIRQYDVLGDRLELTDTVL